MSLRDYQLQAVDELRDAVNRHHSAVYMLPTGAGKTVVAGEISRLAAAKQTQTVLLVHRRELVRQAVDTLAEACPGLTIGVEAAGWPSIPWATLQVGMVQSISRRKFSINPGIVMVDEAHHARAATWEKVLQRWPNAMLIGLTATPERLDGKGLDEFFQRDGQRANNPGARRYGLPCTDSHTHAAHCLETRRRSENEARGISPIRPCRTCDRLSRG